MTTKMTHCPSCNCRIVIKTRRSLTDKLRGVASKYRCHDCSEQFEIKKVFFKLFSVPGAPG